jgi:hypothetical protein
MKAPSPMLVTLLGIVTEVKLLQLEKAEFPMLVTLLGIVTDLKPLQPIKASSPMLVTLYVWALYVTEEGITTSPEYLSK